ncbi:MAG: GNAT family protein [Pseudomonadota bacterium]
MTLTLRKFTTSDIADLFSWFQTERDVLQWAGAAMSWPLNKREFKALIKQHRGVEPVREVWAVMAENRMIGHFQIGLNRRLRTAGLGRIALSPDARGRGLAEPLMALIIARAFEHQWVHRVDLLVYSHNDAAIRAYYRAGMTLEGTRRQSTPLDDEVWDTHIMSILRYEFDKRT